MSRSQMMSRIGPRDTAPEMAIRRALHRAGYRFQLHRKDLPGRPDLTLPKHRAVIFIHGCFWHGHEGCRDFRTPKTNSAFWREKIARNIERDRGALVALKLLGWRVLVVWECATGTKRVEETASEIASWLQEQEVAGEIPKLVPSAGMKDGGSA
ncbi:MAG: DNA mismatch endonuclease Vsr [Rhodobacteraceae bacterium]|nr:DNA mismatch endonuclease Vsr [Paracoccaceae bacterium]